VIAEFVVERERDDEGKIHSLRKRKVRVESGEKYHRPFLLACPPLPTHPASPCHLQARQAYDRVQNSGYCAVKAVSQDRESVDRQCLWGDARRRK
jgi:hypothetical protein